MRSPWTSAAEEDDAALELADDLALLLRAGLIERSASADDTWSFKIVDRRDSGANMLGRMEALHARGEEEIYA
jgi:hypothetical protein